MTSQTLYRRKETYPRIYGLGHGKRSVALRSRLTLQKLTTRAWYQLLSLKADHHLTFLNYGYLPEPNDAPALHQADEINRPTIQLYHRVARPVDLRGKDVLEVGSGRGGGAAYVHKYMAPRSMTGLDLCGAAVAFCRRRHVAEGLSYIHGDATNLPFAPESFDAVLNVESCHCYLHLDRFIAQVTRVLRPGGSFLITDTGPKPFMDELGQRLRKSGLRLVEEEDISERVVRALELTCEENVKGIRQQVPPGLRRIFSNFAGIPGTPVFEALSSGEWEYVRFVLRKD